MRVDRTIWDLMLLRAMRKGIIHVHTDPELWLDKCRKQTIRKDYRMPNDLICAIGKWIADHGCGEFKEED